MRLTINAEPKLTDMRVLPQEGEGDVTVENLQLCGLGVIGSLERACYAIMPEEQVVAMIRALPEEYCLDGLPPEESCGIMRDCLTAMMLLIIGRYCESRANAILGRMPDKYAEEARLCAEAEYTSSTVISTTSVEEVPDDDDA